MPIQCRVAVATGPRMNRGSRDTAQVAERYLKESVGRDGEAALAQEHLGDVYARRGETRLARDAWKKALSRAVEAASQARLKARLNTVKE